MWLLADLRKGEPSVPSFDSIPVIDVGARAGSGPAPAALADRLATTCHEIGFFVAVGHGVDPAVVTDVFDLMHRFFALPEPSRRLIDKQASPHFRGWEPVGSEFTNNRTDFREQVDLWSEWPVHDCPPDSPTRYLRLLGPNQWLPDAVLPGHRAISLRWMRELGALADRVLGALAIGLGLRHDHFRQLFGPMPMSLSKFIRYPPTPAGEAGVNAHHDAGLLTVLAPGPTPGLQVRNHEGSWIDVPQVADGFVINLGEVLQAMTGNYLVATPHRVITRAERYSAAFFCGPSLDVSLAPLPLHPRFAAAVAGSAHHASAGFMALREETERGVGDMASATRPGTYGEQLWNYFARSYPAQMARFHG
jgi:isopenicillin N synthase-like dioxygenase